MGKKVMCENECDVAYTEVSSLEHGEIVKNPVCKDCYNDYKEAVEAESDWEAIEAQEV